MHCTFRLTVALELKSSKSIADSESVCTVSTVGGTGDLVGTVGKPKSLMIRREFDVSASLISKVLSLVQRTAKSLAFPFSVNLSDRQRFKMFCT